MRGWPGGWPPFLWGVATSSHQIEGNQVNDWSRWEAGGHTKDMSGRAADHWRLWAEDLALLPELGLNSYRFSLEWSRIEPEPGQFDEAALLQYRTMIGKMRELGVVPLMTLHHFTLPIWFADRGGFLNPDASRWFCRYVGVVMDALGDLVDIYITINEPMVLVVMGYLIALWPPGQHGFARGLKLVSRLASVHQAAYDMIKQKRPDALVGLAHHQIAFHPWRDHLLDRGTARFLQFLMNDRFIRLAGERQDFIGINYYTRQYGHWSRGLRPFQSRPGTLQSDMGWELYPEGLLEVMRRLGRFEKPILVTENGIATQDDALRTRYLEEHVQVISRAQREGLNVRGYYHWSLLDNFEWAEGFSPRFGLVEVDYGALTRRMRPSAHRYRQIALANDGKFPIT